MRALITGITGQDGSYLADFLAAKDYQVYGLARKVDPTPFDQKIKLMAGDLGDLPTIVRALEIAQPDEIYNLAAQSDVARSFEYPEETWDTNYYGVGRIVNEAIRRNPKVRIYQASSREMFGGTPPPQHEESPFQPVS